MKKSLKQIQRRTCFQYTNDNTHLKYTNSATHIYLPLSFLDDMHKVWHLLQCIHVWLPGLTQHRHHLLPHFLLHFWMLGKLMHQKGGCTHRLHTSIANCLHKYSESIIKIACTYFSVAYNIHIIFTTECLVLDRS